MKTINDDPYEFFQQGGWTFLGGTALDEVLCLIAQGSQCIHLTIITERCR
jgi:hypothetical protein